MLSVPLPSLPYDYIPNLIHLLVFKFPSSQIHAQALFYTYTFYAYAYTFYTYTFIP